MTKKKPGAKIGRPTVMTDKALSKLEECFSLGFSDQDSCTIAEISLETLYRYCKANPAFGIKKEALKKRLLLQSIVVIGKAIKDGDSNTAKWYAERKAKNEFSLRTEIDVNDEPDRKFSSVRIIDGKKIIELK